MIVVDSNVLAYLYLPGEYTAAAEALLEQDADWAAPILWRSEFRNILAGYMRRKALSFEQMVIEVEKGAKRAVLSPPLLAIALAIKLDTKLVTMDEKLLQAFPTRTIALSAG